MFDEICRQTNKLLRSDFIYVTNKDRSGCPFEKISDRKFGEWGIRIPFISHGLNVYGGCEVHGIPDSGLSRDYGKDNVSLYRNGFSKAAWLAVSRFSKETIGHLKLLCEMKGGDGGLLIERCENFMMAEAVYQMMLRTKLRNPNDTSPVELVFIDEYTMKYFMDNYYPGAKVGSVGLVEFEKKQGKASKTRNEVQQLKQQGFTQEMAAKSLRKGLRTVQRHWPDLVEEEMEEMEELPF